HDRLQALPALAEHPHAGLPEVGDAQIDGARQVAADDPGGDVAHRPVRAVPVQCLAEQPARLKEPRITAGTGAEPDRIRSVACEPVRVWHRAPGAAIPAFHPEGAGLVLPAARRADAPRGPGIAAPGGYKVRHAGDAVQRADGDGDAPARTGRSWRCRG